MFRELKPLAPNHTASEWQSQDLPEFEAFALRSGAGGVVEDAPACRPGRALTGGLCFIDGETASDGQGKGLPRDDLPVWSVDICLEETATSVFV